MNRTATILAGALLSGLTLLAGCGGGEPDVLLTTATAATAADASTPQAGRATAARHDPATPVDAAARTQSGRYIARAAAEQREAEGRPVIWIDAGCCAGHDPRLPQQIVFGMQAVHGDDAPVYVYGSDLRQAARLADSLDRLGLRDVWLVTP